jgi:hypothetical protein
MYLSGPFRKEFYVKGSNRLIRLMARAWLISFTMLVALMPPALAGPPFISDDPEPTDYKHFEIYAFNKSTTTRDGTNGAAGIDFNYGAAPNLQLTAVVPAGFDRPSGSGTSVGLSNIEIAAKYRFLRQDSFGLDVSVFPRVFLPSGSNAVGDSHASLLLPVWLQKDWGNGWSAFGGGGCQFNSGGWSQDFCLVGWALTRQVLPKLQLGAELYHQTAVSNGATATTSLGIGARYDLNENYHLLAYIGRGIQNATETNQYSWYTSVHVLSL